MTELSIKDQMKKLKELQEIDSQIYEINSELKEKPLQVEKLKQNFEAKKSHLNELETCLKTIQVERKSRETELKGKEGDIEKANGQLPQLKTNKEYQAKISEIEHIKADKSLIEEKILMDYDRADEVSREIEKEKEVLAGEEKLYLSQKKEVDDLVLVLKDKIKVLQNKRNQVIPGIDKTTISRYERVLQNKGGLAFVPVQNNSCGGCYMNIPPQVINEIKMYDKIISCEMCNRILYLAEDL